MIFKFSRTFVSRLLTTVEYNDDVRIHMYSKHLLYVSDVHYVSVNENDRNKTNTGERGKLGQRGKMGSQTVQGI